MEIQESESSAAITRYSAAVVELAKLDLLERAAWQRLHIISVDFLGEKDDRRGPINAELAAIENQRAALKAVTAGALEVFSRGGQV
jgi:hypothetical protein